MKKAEMVTILVQQTNTPKERALKALDALFDAIGAALARGETVALDGVGRLSLLPIAEHLGRNPRTGQEIVIDAGHKGRLKLSPAMKQRAAQSPTKAAA